MARLGGMSTESFSSARECLSAASVGLAAILRDQKTMPGSSRAHVLLGLSSQTNGPAATCSLSNSPSARSLANSPIESSSFLDADDADDHKEEDICGGADVRESRNSQSLIKEHLGLSHSASQYGFDVWNHGCDLTFRRGFSHVHTHTQTHTHTHQQSHSRVHHDVPKQQMYAARHHLVDKGAGLSDAIVTNAASSVRLSPLSKVSDSQPFHKPARKALTPSWTIPRAERRTYCDPTRDSEHQSAPNWSKILKQPASGASSIDCIGEFGEHDSERLPPHELLAKEYAQSQMMTSSVCEGHGRTLKGRDMRRVRNAVWRQTGFAD